jgi:tRNA/rRNA methyltransferase
MTSLSRIRIILVEPAGARNVGSVARILKNMGLGRLVLVNPSCDHLSAEAQHMAVHAADILNQTQICHSLVDALSGTHRVIATLGRFSDRLVELPRQALPWLLAQEQEQNLEAALIFGREDHGLSNAELQYAQRYVSIPASSEYLSLNLAQAVGICAYELYQAAGDTAAFPYGQQPPPQPATLDQLEAYFQQLEALLLHIGYLYPHTARSRMGHLRSLLQRAEPSCHDVAMLRGMLRQVEWALQHAGQSQSEP